MSIQRSWVAAAAVAAICFGGVLVGCSGGSGEFATVNATPTPSGTGGVAAARTVSGSGAGQVTITWPAPTTVSQTAIVEYHIYRDNTIVGVAPAGTLSFTDTGASGTFVYQQFQAEDAHTLARTTGTRTGLMTGVPHQYRVTYLYNDVTATTQPTYQEVAIGTSNSVTP